MRFLLRRPLITRALRIAVAIEVAALLVGGSWWALTHDERPAWLMFDRELRGSVPPAGQQLPTLSQVEGLEPPLPWPTRRPGVPVLLAATCSTCQSGDIMGGFLRRLAGEGLPGDVELHAVVWGAGAGDWAERHSLPDSVTVHAAEDPPAARAAQRVLMVRDSGVVFLYARDGTWSSTWHMAQLDRHDVAHDLRVLSVR